MERDASQAVEGVRFVFKAHSGLSLLFYPSNQQQILTFEPKMKILGLTCPVPFCAAHNLMQMEYIKLIKKAQTKQYNSQFTGKKNNCQGFNFTEEKDFY